MRALFLFSILWASLELQAQISIGRIHMPQARDTFRYITASPTDFLSQVGQDGPEQTWVFNSSALTSSLVEYKASAQTPYSFYFANTIGLKIADEVGAGQFKLTDMYQFYSATNTSWKAEGLGFSISLAPLPLAGRYSNEDEIYQFPLNYNDRDSSTFRVRISIPGLGAYSQTGYRITEVLGYGEVIVEDDTFECLKVKSIIYQQDTLESQFTNLAFPNNRIEYRWLVREFRAPVVEITGTEVAGNFVPGLSRYLVIPATSGGGGGGSTSVGGFTSEIGMAYPNPVNDLIFIPHEHHRISLVNIAGQEIFGGSGAQTYHLGEVPAGWYILQITGHDGSIQRQRLQKQ